MVLIVEPVKDLHEGHKTDTQYVVPSKLHARTESYESGGLGNSCPLYYIQLV